eukprot:jgi/Chlat1/510/Chrsp103S01094
MVQIRLLRLQKHELGPLRNLQQQFSRSTAAAAAVTVEMASWAQLCFFLTLLLVAQACSAASLRLRAVAVVDSVAGDSDGLVVRVAGGGQGGGGDTRSSSSSIVAVARISAAVATNSRVKAAEEVAYQTVQCSSSTGCRIEVLLHGMQVANWTLPKVQPSDAYTVFISTANTYAATARDAATALIKDNLTKPTELPLDTATARITQVGSGAKTQHTVTVYGASAQCRRCLKALLCQKLHEGSNSTVNVDTKHPYVFELRTGGVNITQTYKLQQHGAYTLVYYAQREGAVRNGSTWMPVLLTDVAGDHTMLPLMVAIAATGVVLALVNCATMQGMEPASERKAGAETITNIDVTPDDAEGEADATRPLLPDSSRQQELRIPALTRVASLDTFRGIALALMILVNYGGGGYWFLAHTEWDGLTPADTLFPSFVWISGVSLAYTLCKTISQQQPYQRGKLARKMVLRAGKLFALGIFLNNGYNLATWRITGVLQYFAVVGSITGLVALYIPGDIAGGTLSWLPTSVLMGVYLLAQQYPHSPHCPAGYIGPGGIGDYGMFPGKYWNVMSALLCHTHKCTGGVHRVIDLSVLTLPHMYHHLFNKHTPAPPPPMLPPPPGTAVSGATCSKLYGCAVYDPEGLLGMLTATTLCFLGYQVNKNLWSPSFIALVGGGASIAFATLYMLVDVLGWWTGAPFNYVGMNSIAIYA